MKRKVFMAVLAVIFVLALCFTTCGGIEVLPVSDEDIKDLVKYIEFDLKFLLDPEKVLDMDRVLDKDGYREDAINPKYRTPEGRGGLSLEYLEGPPSLFFMCKDFLDFLGIDEDGFDNKRRLEFQYLDTPDQFFNQHRWIHRIRQRNEQDGWQVMNRRRMALAWPVTEKGIEAHVRKSIAEGFIPRLKPSQPLFFTCPLGEASPIGDCWYFEVDWSIDSAVLTKSRSYRRGGTGAVGHPGDYPLAFPVGSLGYRNIPIPYPPGKNLGNTPRHEILPNAKDSSDLFVDRIPEVLKKMPWYKGQLKDLVVYGPVFYRRYEGDVDHLTDCPHWQGDEDLRFDILALPADPEKGFELEFIVEVTHANMDRAENLGLAAASAARDTLYHLMGGREGGYILPAGGLRAAAVLDRFKN